VQPRRRDAQHCTCCGAPSPTLTAHCPRRTTRRAEQLRGTATCAAWAAARIRLDGEAHREHRPEAHTAFSHVCLAHGGLLGTARQERSRRIAGPSAYDAPRSNPQPISQPISHHRDPLAPRLRCPSSNSHEQLGLGC
jgi:hypothetical protein